MKSDGLHALAARGIDEFRRFMVMFVYLWLILGLFVLSEAVVLKRTDMSFVAQGFALINAAILAKVMLIAEDLKLGRQFDRLPMLYSIVLKSGLFGIVFIAFHIVEKLVIAKVSGHPLGPAVFSIGGGTWSGMACVWAIMTVSLLPFFALREIGLALGEGELWKLMIRPRPPASSGDA
jgi:hypothetical protein